MVQVLRITFRLIFNDVVSSCLVLGVCMLSFSLIHLFFFLTFSITVVPSVRTWKEVVLCETNWESIVAW